MRFASNFGRIIELTCERKKHIVEYHPDVQRHFVKIKEVLECPDEIRKSRHDSKVLLFYKYFANIKNGKYLVVVVKTNKRNFVITCYLTDKIKTGQKIYDKK